MIATVIIMPNHGALGEEHRPTQTKLTEKST